MCYSTDVMKKFTFEKEIERLRQEPLDQNKAVIMEYMSKELARIEKEYGDEPIRD